MSDTNTTIHPKITMARVMRACQANMREADSYKGFCLACGATANGVEPDARDYECSRCHAKRVYGAEEILVMGAYHNA